MLEKAKAFIEGWIDDHVRAEGYEPEGDHSAAIKLAEACRAAGQDNGLSPRDLDAAAADMVGGGDDLVVLMTNAIEEANDDECERQSERDG